MGNNKLPPEDQERWEAFSASIKPLKHRREPPTLPEQKMPRHFATAPAPPGGLSHPLPPLQISEKSGIDGRSYNTLRKGEMPIDARLDLHGKSHAEAFRHFTNFIQNAAAEGKRCLLVITGKGRPDAENTLRAALPNWINHTEIRPHILTFTPAAPQHGGSGAYAILLKRRRNLK